MIPTRELQIEIIADCHDPPLAGHYGKDKVIELVQRDFWWPKLDQLVKHYIRGCDSCQRAKAKSHAPYGLLQPLPVPEARWSDTSIDFIS